MTTNSLTPVAEVVRDRGSLWLWLLPLLAALAAGALAYQGWKQRGPLITVRFPEGSGIAAGDPVVFRGVRVGDVQSIRLSRDLSRIEVSARLRRDAASIATEGSQFWIVRPEISAGRVSGLDTLLGPRYLQCEPAQNGKPRLDFDGLDRPPAKAPQSNGTLEIVLEASQRGSIDIGSPVVYRGIRVGAVREVQLATDARKVEIAAVIEAQFRDLVRTNSRFWNAGGLGLDWGLIRGLTVKAGSLETLVAGAVAFATPSKPGEVAAPGQRFDMGEPVKEEGPGWSPAIEIHR